MKKKSFKQKCEELGFKYGTVKHYKVKGMTDEEAIEAYLKALNKKKEKQKIVFGTIYKTDQDIAKAFSISLDSLRGTVYRDRCSHEEAVKKILANKNKFTVFGKNYASMNDIIKDLDLKITAIALNNYIKTKNVTMEEAVKHYKYEVNCEDRNKFARPDSEYIELENQTYSITEAIRKYRLSTDYIEKLIKEGKTKKEAILNAYNNNVTKQIMRVTYKGVEYKNKKECIKSLGLDYNRYRKLKSKYQEWSFEKLVDKLIENTKNGIYEKGPTVRSMCEAAGVDYNAAMKIKGNHKELSYEQIIKHLQTCEKRGEFKKLCDKQGVDYSIAYYHRKKNKDWSDEQVLEYVRTILDKDEASLMSLCKKYNIEYYRAIHYKKYNSTLSNEQIIMHFKYDVYINAFGDLVSLGG